MTNAATNGLSGWMVRKSREKPRVLLGYFSQIFPLIDAGGMSNTLLCRVENWTGVILLLVQFLCQMIISCRLEFPRMVR
jgi:hypothetical protein